jgi:hypothetical protein
MLLAHRGVLFARRRVGTRPRRDLSQNLDLRRIWNMLFCHYFHNFDEISLWTRVGPASLVPKYYLFSATTSVSDKCRMQADCECSRCH